MEDTIDSPSKNIKRFMEAIIMEKTKYSDALESINNAINRLRDDKYDIKEEEEIVKSAIADLTKFSSLRNTYIARFIESGLRFVSTIHDEWG